MPAHENTARTESGPAKCAQNHMPKNRHALKMQPHGQQAGRARALLFVLSPAPVAQRLQGSHWLKQQPGLGRHLPAQRAVGSLPAPWRLPWRSEIRLMQVCRVLEDHQKVASSVQSC